MEGWSLGLLKARRWLRLWAADVWRESIAPLTDASARLNYFAVAALLFVLLPRAGRERVLGQVISVVEAVEAFLWAMPAFAAMNGVLAVFQIMRQEREKGSWFGSRFVYHHPVHVVTFLTEAGQIDGVHSFEVPDVENDSLVGYRVAVDRDDQRVKVQLEFPHAPAPTFDWRMVPVEPKMIARLPRSRRMSLWVHAAPEATSTTVRVYVVKFEVGRGTM